MKRADRWTERKQKKFDKALKESIMKDHDVKKTNPYTKNFPKGVKNKSGNIEIEFNKESDGMRAIVFDNRDRTVHDFYGKNKRDALRKARKVYPTTI